MKFEKSYAELDPNMMDEFCIWIQEMRNTYLQERGFLEDANAVHPLNKIDLTGQYI